MLAKNSILAPWINSRIFYRIILSARLGLICPKLGKFELPKWAEEAGKNQSRDLRASGMHNRSFSCWRSWRGRIKRSSPFQLAIWIYGTFQGIVAVVCSEAVVGLFPLTGLIDVSIELGFWELSLCLFFHSCLCVCLSYFLCVYCLFVCLSA